MITLEKSLPSQGPIDTSFIMIYDHVRPDYLHVLKALIRSFAASITPGSADTRMIHIVPKTTAESGGPHRAANPRTDDGMNA